MAHGEKERDHVVHGADEDAPEDYPERDGRPAELRGEDGPDDRPCARDGGEVVPEEHHWMSRHEVYAVPHRVRGRGTLRVHAYRPGDELGIEKVCKREKPASAKQQNSSVHVV